MKFTLMVLRYFQKVAELQHVTRAAEALHVAQPSVSRVIKSMEQELNVPLFERRGRNIILTSYGEVFLRHVDRILKEADAAKKRTGRSQGTGTDDGPSFHTCGFPDAARFFGTVQEGIS